MGLQPDNDQMPSFLPPGESSREAERAALLARLAELDSENETLDNKTEASQSSDQFVQTSPIVQHSAVAQPYSPIQSAPDAPPYLPGTPPTGLYRGPGKDMSQGPEKNFYRGPGKKSRDPNQSDQTAAVFAFLGAFIVIIGILWALAAARDLGYLGALGQKVAVLSLFIVVGAVGIVIHKLHPGNVGALVLVAVSIAALMGVVASLRLDISIDELAVTASVVVIAMLGLLLSRFLKSETVACIVLASASIIVAFASPTNHFDLWAQVVLIALGLVTQYRTQWIVCSFFTTIFPGLVLFLTSHAAFPNFKWNSDVPVVLYIPTTLAAILAITNVGLIDQHKENSSIANNSWIASQVVGLLALTSPFLSHAFLSSPTEKSVVTGVCALVLGTALLVVVFVSKDMATILTAGFLGFWSLGLSVSIFMPDEAVDVGIWLILMIWLLGSLFTQTDLPATSAMIAWGLSAFSTGWLLIPSLLIPRSESDNLVAPVISSAAALATTLAFIYLGQKKLTKMREVSLYIGSIMTFGYLGNFVLNITLLASQTPASADALRLANWVYTVVLFATAVGCTASGLASDAWAKSRRNIGFVLIGIISAKLLFIDIAMQRDLWRVSLFIVAGLVLIVMATFFALANSKAQSKSRSVSNGSINEGS